MLDNSPHHIGVGRVNVTVTRQHLPPFHRILAHPSYCNLLTTFPFYGRFATTYGQPPPTSHSVTVWDLVGQHRGAVSTHCVTTLNNNAFASTTRRATLYGNTCYATALAFITRSLCSISATFSPAWRLRGVTVLLRHGRGRTRYSQTQHWGGRNGTSAERCCIVCATAWWLKNANQTRWMTWSFASHSLHRYVLLRCNFHPVGCCVQP